MVSVEFWTATAACLLCCLALGRAESVASDNDQGLPDYIHVCYRDDPKLAECAKTTIYGIIRKLKNDPCFWKRYSTLLLGIPELNVPPIEPLYKDEIDAFDVAGFLFKFKNIYIRGISGLKFTWTSASLETGVFEFVGVIDPIEIDAIYELTGSIFFLPIQSAGTISVIGRELEFRVYCELDRNDTTFIKSGKLVTLQTYTTSGSTWISNLGPFEAVINRLLNQKANSRFIINHLTPIIDETVAQLLYKFGNRIFNTVPYDALFPVGTDPNIDNAPEETQDADHVIMFKKISFLERIKNFLDN